MMPETKTRYGRYVHGIPQLSRSTNRGTWRRADTYYCDHPDLNGQVDLLFAEAGDDQSPIFSGRYDGACSCCYLNFPHTTDAHNARLNQKDGDQ